CEGRSGDEPTRGVARACQRRCDAHPARSRAEIDGPAIAAAACGRGDPVPDRRAFVVAAVAKLLIASGISAQESTKRYRLGIISAGNNPRSAAFFAAFEQRLRELGWIDGKTLSVDFEAGDSPDKLSAIATRMVRGGVDVFLA